MGKNLKSVKVTLFYMSSQLIIPSINDSKNKRLKGNSLFPLSNNLQESPSIQLLNESSNNKVVNNFNLCNSTPSKSSNNSKQANTGFKTIGQQKLNGKQGRKRNMKKFNLKERIAELSTKPSDTSELTKMTLINQSLNFDLAGSLAALDASMNKLKAKASKFLSEEDRLSNESRHSSQKSKTYSFLQPVKEYSLVDCLNQSTYHSDSSSILDMKRSQKKKSKKQIQSENLLKKRRISNTRNEEEKIEKANKKLKISTEKLKTKNDKMNFSQYQTAITYNPENEVNFDQYSNGIDYQNERNNFMNDFFDEPTYEMYDHDKFDFHSICKAEQISPIFDNKFGKDVVNIQTDDYSSQRWENGDWLYRPNKYAVINPVNLNSDILPANHSYPNRLQINDAMIKK